MGEASHHKCEACGAEKECLSCSREVADLRVELLKTKRSSENQKSDEAMAKRIKALEEHVSKMQHAIIQLGSKVRPAYTEIFQRKIAVQGQPVFVLGMAVNEFVENFGGKSV